LLGGAECLTAKASSSMPMKFQNTNLTCLCAFLVAALTFFTNPVGLAQSSAPAEMQPGAIVITGFKGSVQILNAKSPAGAPPVQGSTLKQGDTIITGATSHVSLAFSNGAVMEIESESKFVVQEYLQEPWDFSPEAWKEMESEPSKSQTTGNLAFGDVTASVKKLKPGSSMQITTPLGVAGIRGTTFRVSSRNNPDGTPSSSSVAVTEGQVEFSPQGGGEPSQVTAGLSSVITVTPGENGQGPTTEPPATSPISEQESGLIQQIVEGLQNAPLSQSFINAMQNSSTEQGDSGSQMNLPPPIGGIGSSIPPINIPQPTPTPTPTPTPEPTPTPTPAPSNL